MFTTEPAEQVANIVEEYKLLIDRATLLCREYIKMRGYDYGYQVYDVSIERDKIYFRYRHFDGVIPFGPPDSIPLSYLSDENWQAEAANSIKGTKDEALRYSQLKAENEEKYLVPEYVVLKYLEDCEGPRAKEERLEWLALKDKFEQPFVQPYFLGGQKTAIHPKWNQR